jgi:hypothetical protein
MHFIQLSLALAALAVSNAAVTIDNTKRATALEVTLAPTENAAEVVATVKNVGAEDLNLLTLGTFLDSAPVQKLAVLDESGMKPSRSIAQYYSAIKIRIIGPVPMTLSKSSKLRQLLKALAELFTILRIPFSTSV